MTFFLRMICLSMVLTSRIDRPGCIEYILGGHRDFLRQTGLGEFT
jgi:hypothetical protein